MVLEKVQTEEFKQGEVPSAMVDERGFKFFEQWARKRQVFLNTDGEGNIVITRNLDQMINAKLHKGLEDDPHNNVLKASYKATDRNRANSYDTASQKSTDDKDFWESLDKGDNRATADAISNKYGHANDSSVRPERRFYFRAVKGVQGRTPDETAAWQAVS